jgi:hypothetical protein
VGYHDWTRGNTGGTYRDDDVDVEACGATPPCYDVGYIQPGEWLAYAVHFDLSASYIFRVRTAAPRSGAQFHIELNGADVSGPLSPPATGSYRAWADTISHPIVIEAGDYDLRLVADSRGFNLDTVSVTSSDASVPAAP